MSTEQHALVLSGNGAYGAYEVGVVKALLHGVCPATGHQAIRPEIYAGTSVGALTAAIMVSESGDNDIRAVESLEHLWLTRISESFSGENSIYRWRVNPFDYARPSFYLPNPVKPFVNIGKDAAYLFQDFVKRSSHFLGAIWERPSVRQVGNAFYEVFDWSVFVDHTPLKALIRDTVDLAKVASAKKRLRITTANWKEGKPRTFTNRELFGEQGRQALTAALVIPGVAPPELVDTEQFLDGAVLMNRPLRPALEAREKPAEGEKPRRLNLHVVYVDPEYAQTPLPDVQNTFSTIFRLYLLAFARSVNAEVERAALTNRSLQFLELLQDPVYSSTAEGQGVETMKLWKRLNRDTADKVQVVIHRYRSSKHISDMMGMFQFDRKRIEKLIERGYRDAQIHDCSECECIGADEA